MKTHSYYTISIALIFSAHFAWGANTGASKCFAPITQAAVEKAKGSKSGKTHLPSRFNNASRAAGQPKQNIFLQDIRIYTISGKRQMVMSYIPEPAASKVGYMGFKVGEKVKWGALLDSEAPQNNSTQNPYQTGTINMLDSDRCYIQIDHSERVAVKLYEDIEKLNP